MSCKHEHIQTFRTEDNEPVLWACAKCCEKFVHIDELLVAEDRIAALEARIAELEEEVARLNAVAEIDNSDRAAEERSFRRLEAKLSRYEALHRAAMAADEWDWENICRHSDYFDDKEEAILCMDALSKSLAAIKKDTP